MVRGFTNGQGEWVQTQVESYQRLKKWYLLNTQHYKVAIQEKEWCPLIHLSVVAIEKGAFKSPMTTVGQLNMMLLNSFYFLLTIFFSFEQCNINVLLVSVLIWFLKEWKTREIIVVMWVRFENVWSWDIQKVAITWFPVIVSIWSQFHFHHKKNLGIDYQRKVYAKMFSFPNNFIIDAHTNTHTHTHTHIYIFKILPIWKGNLWVTNCTYIILPLGFIVPDNAKNFCYNTRNEYKKVLSQNLNFKKIKCRCIHSLYNKVMRSQSLDFIYKSHCQYKKKLWWTSLDIFDQEFLAKHRIVQVSHPPYSPDRHFCEFFLFAKGKIHLIGKIWGYWGD